MEPSCKQMCEDILALMDYTKRHIFRIAESYKLTPQQVGALHCIVHGSSSMGGIAQRMHCDASNVTGIIDRLVAQKLVVRTENAQDRRAKMLQLTPRGQQIMDEIAQALPEQIGCNKLTAQERETLHALLIKLTTV